MPKYTPDPIERARIEREIAEREARKSHPAYEPSDPPSDPPPMPAEWPPPPIAGRPGQGTGSARYDPNGGLHAASRSFVSVWTIIGIIAAAAGGGWGARAFFGDTATPAKVAAIENDVRDLKASNESVRLTLVGMQKDIEWIKGAIQAAQQPKPLEPEKRKPK